MNIYRKLIAGDSYRPSRFHDLEGKMCGPVSALGMIPSLATWSVAHVRRQWVQQPWWVWAAIRFVESVLKPEDRVLEIGSGYSSLWLARRCRQVISVEGSPEWKNIVDRLAIRAGISNLSIVAEQSLAGFESVYKSGYSPDVVIVDAESRPEIFRRLMSCQPHPRVIIHDDTDAPENQNAPRIGEEHGFSVRTFRGFKPQCIHTCATSVMTQ